MAVSYKFHDNEWKDISVQAKGLQKTILSVEMIVVRFTNLFKPNKIDFIRKLLVDVPTLRNSAKQVCIIDTLSRM